MANYVTRSWPDSRPDIPILYNVRNHNKISVFIFDPEKSVVLFSHPTQPTHELGDLDKPRTYWKKGQDLYIKGPRTFQWRASWRIKALAWVRG